MSGHSKWAQIKHKKAATDAKRGNLFSKLARAVSVAAKEGGGDPATNPKLRLAVERARNFNMPTDNIERAIAKAASAKEVGEFSPITYEIYGPGGSAIVAEGITDNKHRTAAEIKHLLSDHGGKLAESGAVGWLFLRKGCVVLERRRNPKLQEPDSELRLIEAGAEEIDQADDAVTLFAAPEKRAELEDAIATLGFEISDAADVLIAKNEVSLEGNDKLAAKKLIEALGAHDDIEEVWSNIENL